jgi:hypothetical protein
MPIGTEDLARAEDLPAHLPRVPGNRPTPTIGVFGDRLMLRGALCHLFYETADGPRSPPSRRFYSDARQSTVLPLVCGVQRPSRFHACPGVGRPLARWPGLRPPGLSDVRRACPSASSAPRVLAPRPIPSATAVSTHDSRVDLSVSIARLLVDYRKKPARADAAYKGKRVRLCAVTAVALVAASSDRHADPVGTLVLGLGWASSVWRLRSPPSPSV